MDGYIVGGPELVAEVAATSANYNLTEKLPLYLLNNVREFVVSRMFDREIDWFVLRNGQYEPLALSPEGCFKSEGLPGLWLDAAGADPGRHGPHSADRTARDREFRQVLEFHGPVTASCEPTTVSLKDGRVGGSPTKDKLPWRNVRHGSGLTTPRTVERTGHARAGKSGRGINPAENVGGSCLGSFATSTSMRPRSRDTVSSRWRGCRGAWAVCVLRWLTTVSKTSSSDQPNWACCDPKSWRRHSRDALRRTILSASNLNSRAPGT